jgi:hypothetical protein
MYTQLLKDVHAMNSTIHIINEYPLSYEFIGYVNQIPFVMEIDKQTNEIKKFKHMSRLIQIHLQDYVFQTCMHTILNNLMIPRILSTDLKAESPKGDESDIVQMIMKRNGTQNTADQLREAVHAG